MAFCTHCIAICNTLSDDSGFISCSSCGKVLRQILKHKLTLGSKFKRITRIKTINSKKQKKQCNSSEGLQKEEEFMN